MAGLHHEFLAHLKNTGVSKTSHFQVMLPVDPALIGGKTTFDFGRTLSFRCEATDLPGRQLVTQENRIYGPVYKTPYQSLYQEITLNFLETQDMTIRKYFELWVDFIFESVSNRLAYPNLYRKDILITQYDISPKQPETAITGIQPTTTRPSNNDTLAPLLTWNLISAFPTAINQMPVSWTEDGFHRVSVTIAYEYYVLSEPSQPKKQSKIEGSTTKRKTGSAK